jgi:hypothetical protein
MQDISGFGLRLSLRASKTFPQGITLTQFADDADAFDAPSEQIAEVAMGLNGDMVAWSKANPCKVTINLIPGSEDDRNMQVLAAANRVSRGKRSARDVITLSAVLPDGRAVIYAQGKLTDAMQTESIASSGRKKSMPYGFAFERVTRG